MIHTIYFTNEDDIANQVCSTVLYSQSDVLFHDMSNEGCFTFITKHFVLFVNVSSH